MSLFNAENGSHFHYRILDENQMETFTCTGIIVERRSLFSNKKRGSIVADTVKSIAVKRLYEYVNSKDGHPEYVDVKSDDETFNNSLCKAILPWIHDGKFVPVITECLNFHFESTKEWVARHVCGSKIEPLASKIEREIEALKASSSHSKKQKKRLHGSASTRVSSDSGNEGLDTCNIGDTTNDSGISVSNPLRTIKKKCSITVKTQTKEQFKRSLPDPFVLRSDV